MSASLSVAASQFTEGSLEVKLPTISTDEKQRWEESEKRRVREEKRREEKRRRKKLKKRKSQKKEDQVSEKVGKSRNTAFFQ